MYGREQRVLLRHYLEQGVGKAELARKFGVSRRTIYYWIENDELDRSLDDAAVEYGPRKSVDRKIDPYRELIETRLKSYPKLSAARLLEEIRAAGYQGGYTQVKELVRSLRPTPEAEEVVRFETPPGVQGQVDFGEFRLPWGKRYALLVVLGYSRLLWLRFFERQTMDVLFRGLEAAFDLFQGVPQELLFDQMKAVIVDDQRDADGSLIENAEFLRFAAHWCFKVRACRPYRAQTKGKVERPIRYVRESFFYAREFLNDDDLNAQADSWLMRANQRIHGTTREKPIVRFERDELSTLQPLAPQPYRSMVRRVPADAAKKQPDRRTRQPSVERRSLKVYQQLSEIDS